MFPAYQKLTEELQKLQAQKGGPIPPIPKFIDASEFKLSPEVEEFLRKREEYREKTKDLDLDIIFD